MTPSARADSLTDVRGIRVGHFTDTRRARARPNCCRR